MYENEIYSNSDTGNGTGGNQYATYQTTGSVSGSGMTGTGQDSGNKGSRERGRKATGKKGGVFRKLMLSVAMGLCFGLFAGIGFYAVQLGTGQLSAVHADNKEEVISQPSTDITPNTPVGGTNVSHVTMVQTDLTDVVEKVMPAMVSIVNNFTSTGTTFWGQSYSQDRASAGSGIIVSENEGELLIVSNNHVVEGTTTLEVTFIDGSVAEAVIKGTDPEMDLAVIAVKLEDLTEETRKAITVAALGNSDELKLGEPVIAIGNALGYGQSVTNGIVSALNREVTMSDGSKGTYIQTNAAINEGNSGGALLNVDGEVIGINSSKLYGTTVEGMGYAIPISSASPIITELMERQTRTKVAEAEMGYMGITMQNVPEDMSQVYNMPRGVFVYAVEQNSAADKAGILRGDIITRFDGQRVSSYTDLQDVIQYYKAGDTVTVTVNRLINGEYEVIELEVILGERKADR